MITFYYQFFIFCVFVNLASSKYRVLQAEAYPGYQDRIEMSGAIDIVTSSSLRRCASYCVVNGECVAFFYNANLQRCVMHAEYLYWKAPSIQDVGWKYYKTKDVSGGCPSSYQYLRNRDYCYTIEEIDSINFSQIRIMCNQTGGKLAAVNSQEKYELIVQIIGNRPNLQVRVPIQGSKIGNEWILDDGTPLQYFNWHLAGGQPSNSIDENCLAIKVDNQFYDVVCDFAGASNSNGIFVCEK